MKSSTLCSVVLFLAITLFVSAHSHDGYCDHDHELERTKNVEAHLGKRFDRRAVDVGSVGRRENQVAWGAIRAEFNTDYILNDVESRTCYSSTGVRCEPNSNILDIHNSMWCNRLYCQLRL